MAPSESAATNANARAAHPVRGYLWIAAAALCWGTSATLGRAVFTGRLLGGAVHTINPLILAQSRTTFSLLVLAPVLLARRGVSGLRLQARDLWLSIALGVLGIASSNYFYYLSIQRTNVATAIIIQYTAPVWVLLYMVAKGRQRATWRRIGSVALAIVGAVLAIGAIGSRSLRLDTLGVVASLIAAVAFAYYNVSGSDLVRRHDRWSVLLFAFLGAALFWQVVNPPWRVVAAHYTSGQWGFMAVFAVTSVLLPFAFYFGGLHWLDPTRAIVTSCLEPVFSIFIAAVVLGELVGPLQVLGIAVVLAATVLVQMPDKEHAESGVIVEPME